LCGVVNPRATPILYDRCNPFCPVYHLQPLLQVGTPAGGSHFT
jgi:hypothetical protein